MPHKNPDQAKAYKRAYYLANKEKYSQVERERSQKIAEERRIHRQEQMLYPLPVKAKQCKACGTDITLTYRSKSGMLCKPCVAAYMKNYRDENRQKIAEMKKTWKQKNAEHCKQKDSLYAKLNPEKRAEARKKWEMLNPGISNAAKAANKRERQKRVPIWLSDDEKWMIAQAYEIASVRTKVFGFDWHVDHIIPIKGKFVSGLHVPENLQVIPASVNLRKSNRVELI